MNSRRGVGRGVGRGAGRGAVWVLMLAVAGQGASAPAWGQVSPSQPSGPVEMPPTTKETGVDLRPKFVAGRVTRYSMSVESVSQLKSTSSPDLNQDQTQSQTLDLLVRVIEAGTNGAEIELVYERVRAAFKTADMDISADSASASGGAKSGSTNAKSPTGTQPVNPPAKRSTQRGTPPATNPSTTQPASPAVPDLDGFAAMEPQVLLQEFVKNAAGTKLRIKTDGAGNLVSVSGGEQLAGGGAGGMLGGLGGLGGGMGGMGGIAGNPHAVANWVVGGVGAPASGLVNVGQKWTTTSNLAGTPIGAFSMATTNTLRSFMGGQGTIAFRGSAEAQSAAALAMPGFQLKGASYAGEAQWDAKRGELGGMNATTDVSISGNVGGIAAEMTAKQRVRVSREN